MRATSPAASPRRREPSVEPRVGSHRWWLWPVLVALTATVLAVAQLVALWRMEYSTSSLEPMPLATARAAPDPSRLGSLHWDVATYQRAPRLQPLRDVVTTHCGGRAPVATATCLADLFAARFDHGAPRVDLFESRYDPAEDLRAHLAGEAGHCVTRSGLIAAALLASGMLARVVQLQPGELGHNVVEAWDARDGWTVIDPTYGSLLDAANGQHSALAALAAPQRVRWLHDGLSRPPAIAAMSPADADAGVRHSFDSVVVYPEPWLYTRVGGRVALWPLRGRFVVIGEPRWDYGVGQAVLRAGTVACALPFGVAVLLGLRGLLKRRASRARA